MTPGVGARVGTDDGNDVGSTVGKTVGTAVGENENPAKRQTQTDRKIAKIERNKG